MVAGECPEGDLYVQRSKFNVLSVKAFCAYLFLKDASFLFPLDDDADESMTTIAVAVSSMTWTHSFIAASPSAWKRYSDPVSVWE